ncbi:MAG: hypothetical protein LUO88_02295, partial [Methanoregulaceae archaeon]|nr:hypothetical protein [Methanoregulaceae archaeon]
ILPAPLHIIFIVSIEYFAGNKQIGVLIGTPAPLRPPDFSSDHWCQPAHRELHGLFGTIPRGMHYEKIKRVQRSALLPASNRVG